MRIVEKTLEDGASISSSLVLMALLRTFCNVGGA
jgi:hypothetical protein